MIVGKPGVARCRGTPEWVQEGICEREPMTGATLHYRTVMVDQRQKLYVLPTMTCHGVSATPLSGCWKLIHGFLQNLQCIYNFLE